MVGIREPAVAGAFYPTRAAELTDTVTALLADATAARQTHASMHWKCNCHSCKRC